MGALWELFADLFSKVVRLEQQLHRGEQPAFADVWGTIDTALKQQAALAKTQEQEQAFWEAVFAVVAWIDETVLRVASWEGFASWKQCPLQQHYFDIRDAGDQFFPRLKDLQPEQRALREVYYLCVALGFHGPYEERQLASLRQELAQHLPVAVEEPRHMFYVTPQPYESAKVLPHPEPAPKRLWRRALLMTLGCCGLVLGAWSIWSSPQPPSPPPGILDELRRSSPELLDCTNIVEKVTQTSPPVIGLEGRVQNAAQAAAILARARDLRKGAYVSETFTRIPRPFCEVLAMLDRFLDNERGLTAELKPLYTVGDHLVLQGQTPAFASYLYVFYITGENGVWQLSPHVWTGQSPPLLAPKTLYTIGKKRFTVQIARPAGRKCIVVLASKEPLPLVLPTQQPPQAVPMVSFLNALEQALHDATPMDVAVVYQLIHIRDSREDVPRG